MELRNFVSTGQDPQRPSGTCEAGGIPASVFFDRSDPAVAEVTLRFSTEAGAPLPPVARNRTELLIAGTAVPIREVHLEDGSGALRGALDPAAVEAFTGPVSGPAARPADGNGPQGAPESEPGPRAEAAPLVALARRHAEAKRERAAFADRIEALRKSAAGLRAQLEAAEGELATASETADGHADRCADLLQQLRDALDAEE